MVTMGFGERTSHSRRIRIGTGASLLAVALVGVLVLLDRGVGGAEAAAMDPEIRGTMGVFRAARTIGDRLPGEPSAALRAADDMQPGENPDLSRRVLHADGEAYVWPMDGGMCHSSPAGSGCVPTWVIRDRGVDIGVQARLDLREETYDDVRVFGIARDGVATVRLRLQNGVERIVMVRDNTFLALDLPDRPVAVTWTDQSGVHSLQVPGQSAEELAEEIVGP